MSTGCWCDGLLSCKLIYSAPTLSQCMMGDCFWCSRAIFWASPQWAETFELYILFKVDANMTVGEAVQWHDATGFEMLMCYYKSTSRMKWLYTVKRNTRRVCRMFLFPLKKSALFSFISTYLTTDLLLFFNVLPLHTELYNVAQKKITRSLLSVTEDRTTTLNGTLSFMKFDLDTQSCTI